jgi:hypothetical protein
MTDTDVHIPSVSTLILKVRDSAHPLDLLRQIDRNVSELFIAFYDLSRKVTIPDIGAPGAFFDALHEFPHLHTLDMCLAYGSFGRSALEAAHVLMSHGIRRGWWWERVVDADYGQLEGFHRTAWVADCSGGVSLSQPEWLHPLVVRNTDGQGTQHPRPDELWG